MGTQTSAYPCSPLCDLAFMLRGERPIIKVSIWAKSRWSSCYAASCTIFRDFAGGISPRAIAKKLNQKGIPGPSGRPWRDTTIRGHFGRGTGILNNELYIGRLIWNRLTYLKDPKTGRRRSRHNPPEKWIVQDVPMLRIVDNVFWQASKPVRARFDQASAWRMRGLPAFGSAVGLATY